MLWQAAIVACAGISLASPVQVESSQITKRDNATSDSDPMLQLSPDKDFHFEMLRTMGMAPYRASDVSDILIAAHKIKKNDMESYSDAFHGLATKSEKKANNIDADKHPVSAADLHFKAATYYRSADFFLHGNWSDPRINAYWKKNQDHWNKANDLLDNPGERITLKGKDSNFSIPAIYFSSELKGKRPTIIVGTGYDGSQEELYHNMGIAILQRGMNVLLYEGPGQPTVRREQNLGFIPEWEKVITPLVDYLYTRKDVDKKAIGLVGSSFGGYLAPRAAAVEHRLAAVMALDGIYDYGAVSLNELGSELTAMFKAGKKELIDKYLTKSAFDPSTETIARWGLQQGLWSFHTHSPFDFLTQTQQYTMKGWADKVKTPVFVGDAQTDLYFPGQAKQLAEALGDWAHYHLYKAEDGVGTHCSLGGLVLANQVVLDWFEGIVADKQHGC